MIVDYNSILCSVFFYQISTRCLTCTGMYVLFKGHSLKDNQTFSVLQFLCEMIYQYSVIMKTVATVWSYRLCQSKVFMNNYLRSTNKMFFRKSPLIIKHAYFQLGKLESSSYLWRTYLVHMQYASPLISYREIQYLIAY